MLVRRFIRPKSVLVQNATDSTSPVVTDLAATIVNESTNQESGLEFTLQSANQFRESKGDKPAIFSRTLEEGQFEKEKHCKMAKSAK